MRPVNPPDQATIDRLKETHMFYQRKGLWYVRLTAKGRAVMLEQEK